MPEYKVLQTLMIEDDPFFVSFLKYYGTKMTSIKLEVHHKVTLEESLDFLDKNPQIQLIFLDYRLHSTISGLEILQHIRAKGIKIPIIVVTGSGDEEVAVAMMKAGASDYLVKGSFTPEMLERSIVDTLQHHEQFSEILQKDSVLKDMALKSALNGVCIMDTDGRIDYVNLSFVQMWGYGSEDELIGRHLKELLSKAQDFDAILDFLHRKRSWLGELLCLKKSGAEFYSQTLLSVIEYKGEDRPHVMASFIDVTRVKDEEKKREDLYRGIMEVFALRAEEVGNVETAGHIHRIAAYTKLVAERLKCLPEFKEYIDEKYVNDISYASMLHDVGKWRTPNEILLKPAQLSFAEREIIKQHPRLGVEMLTPLLRDKGSNQYLKLVESIVLYHHENWDGTGYPDGLKGEEIPLSARIVAITDVYDALTSQRSYRKALSHEDALEIIKKEKHKFDPRILQIFIDYQNEFKDIRDKIN